MLVDSDRVRSAGGWLLNRPLEDIQSREKAARCQCRVNCNCPLLIFVLQVEIAAHARSISAIDIHPTLPMVCLLPPIRLVIRLRQVAACSEDTFLSVWSLPTSSNSQVCSLPSLGFSQPLSVQVKNLSLVSTNTSLLTGVRFCGKDRSLIAVRSDLVSRSAANRRICLHSAYDSRFIAVVPAPGKQ